MITPGTRALILAGGRGLRLKPCTFSIPKSLIPLGDRAMLEIVIRQLRNAGVPRVYVALNYLSRLIRVYLRTMQEEDGIHCECIVEDTPLGTAGALGLLPSDAETTIICNADVLTDLRWADVLAAHHADRADLTIVGVRRADTLPYGCLETDDSGRYVCWKEREPLNRLVSAGLYVAGPMAVTAIGRGERVDMPELARRVRQSEGHVTIFEHRGAWFDIGDWTQYEQAAIAFTANPERYLLQFASTQAEADRNPAQTPATH